MFRAFLVFCLSSVAAFSADLPGVRNFHQLNDRVYRGAQPTEAGFGQLADLGVRTIIDLRLPGERSMDEAKIVKQSGMRYISIPLKGFSAPSHTDIARVLAILNDPSAGPVFVHCRRGADRTGTVLACYRISHDGWDNRKALTEARSLGMRWFERAMQSYVLKYSPAMAPQVESTVALAQ